MKRLFTSIQIMIFIPAIVFECLSHKKMGIMRYLLYKQLLYEQNEFNTNSMNTYKIILILILSICCIMLIYNIVKMKNNHIIKEQLYAISMNLIGINFIILKKNLVLNAYHFFLIGILMSVVLQYLKLVLDFINKDT